MPARIAIVGSRKLPAEDARRVIFNGVASTPADAVIVSGGARGPIRSRFASADREAARAAAFYRRALDVLEADWDGEGKRAGFIRNVRIVETLCNAGDRLVAVWDGVSHGTHHVVTESRAAGVPTRVIVLRGGP